MSNSSPKKSWLHLGIMLGLAGLVALSLLIQRLLAPIPASRLSVASQTPAPVLIMVRPRPGGHMAGWPLLPNFVLYADGRLLSHQAGPELRQTQLTTTQVCGLVAALKETGLLEVPSAEREDTWSWLGGWYVELNIGEPRYVDHNAPGFADLQQRLALLAQTSTPYVFTRLALVMKVQDNFWDTAAPTWPSTLPSLASLNQSQPEAVVMLTDETARAVDALLQDEIYYRENGVTYWLATRPLLPGEELNDVSVNSLYFSDVPNPPLLAQFPSAGVTLPCPTAEALRPTAPPTLTPWPTPEGLELLTHPKTFVQTQTRLGQHTAPGQLEFADAVAFSPAGEVVVADSGNQRLQWFTADGTFLRATALPTDTLMNDVTFGPNAEVIVASNDEVLILDAAGQVQKRFAVWATEPGDLGPALLVAAAPDGTLYLAGLGDEVVSMWTLAGQQKGLWEEAKMPFDVRDLEVDAQGNLYIISRPIGVPTRERIYRRAPDGTVTELHLAAETLAPAANGTFYALQNQTHTISHFAADGKPLAKWPASEDLWTQSVDLALAPDESQVVWLNASTYEGNIKTYTPAGQQLHAFGFTYGDPTFGQFYGHHTFAVAPHGETWLLNEGEGPYRLLYLAANGDLLHYFAELPEDLFKCDTYFMAATTQASVWVADACLGQLTQVAATGQVVAQWQGDFDSISGLALAPDEQSLYLTDSAQHMLLQMSLTGEVLARWDTTTWGVTKPKAVEVDSEGAMYLLDTAKPQLLLGPTPATLHPVPLPLPNGYFNEQLAIDPTHQRIYVSGLFLQVLDLAGNLVGVQELEVSHLGLDAQGHLYASNGRNRIYILTPIDPTP